MTPEVVVQFARETLVTALLLAAPILAVATVVSLLINIAQVMTSIQEQTVATVPRLAVVAIATFVMLPWMLRKLMGFTLHLFGDFHRCLG
jgi:flagellar biosynthetic protein FliQ